MALTQQDLEAIGSLIDQKLKPIETRLDSIESRLDRVEQRLDVLERDMFYVKRQLRVVIDILEYEFSLKKNEDVIKQRGT